MGLNQPASRSGPHQRPSLVFEPTVGSGIYGEKCFPPENLSEHQFRTRATSEPIGQSRFPRRNIGGADLGTRQKFKIYGEKCFPPGNDSPDKTSRRGTRLRIYLDAYCLSRLTDDQSQPRVRAEAEAVEHVMRMVREGQATWVSSTVLSIEVSRNPDPDRRRDAEALLLFANEIVVPKSGEADRADKSRNGASAPFDALHLASAEKGGADVFLTTDDGLLRRARRSLGQLHIRVENPVSWYEEVQS
jgi:predicted nucleic acid-binding protein